MSEAARAFQFEGTATPSEAADILRRIAEGIRRGNLSLSMGEESVAVFPDGEIAMEIEASDKKDKSKIQIAVAWKQPTEHDDD